MAGVFACVHFPTSFGQGWKQKHPEYPAIGILILIPLSGIR